MSKYTHTDKKLTEKAQKILENYPVKFEQILERPDKLMSDMEGAKHYSCSIGDDSQPFYFSKGSACEYGVSQDELLSCLMSDSQTVLYCSDFNEFCDEFGYDNDSRKAEQTYLACQRIAERIQATFDSEELEILQEYYSEY